jgi:hypothetical protein
MIDTTLNAKLHAEHENTFCIGRDMLPIISASLVSLPSVRLPGISFLLRRSVCRHMSIDE